MNTVPSVVLICHEGDRLDTEGLASWLASTMDLRGLVVIRNSQRRLWRTARREIRRAGWLGFADVVAFRLYAAAALAREQREWKTGELARLRVRYPADLAHVPRIVVDDPNSAEARDFLAAQQPDLIIARCKVILKPAIFSIARAGTFALHPGICPEYRNAHGCFWALANRDLDRVGMTLLRIDAGVDTGPVYLQATCAFDECRESHIVIQYRVVSKTSMPSGGVSSPLPVDNTRRSRPKAAVRRPGDSRACPPICDGSGMPAGAAVMPLVSLLFHDVYRGEPRESGFDSAAADRYKLSIPEFETQLSGVARVRSDLPILASRFLLQQVSDTEDTSDAFPYLITVDDGGLSYYTVVADRLERLGWRGHCFVTTDCIGQRGFLTVRQIRELDARGHVIGSHSASHPTRFSACSIPQMRREWTRSREALQDLLGHPVNVASVPGGYFSAVVARTAGDAGLRVLFTSEPTTRTRTHHGCFVIGRYTVRARCRDDFASRIVLPPPQTRAAAWAGWNAKKVVKPLLGSTYARVADWLLATRSGTLKSEV